jgi:hypothetical protein
LFCSLLPVIFFCNLLASVESSAGGALEALSDLNKPTCRTIREGLGTEVCSAFSSLQVLFLFLCLLLFFPPLPVCQVFTRDLVPGDIVEIKTGDVVPADIRLIKAVELKVSEMLLTVRLSVAFHLPLAPALNSCSSSSQGEGEDVTKVVNPSHEQMEKSLTPANMAFSSTTVANGNAVGVVVATGMKTRVGNIARLLKGGNAQNEQGHGNNNQKDKNEGAPSLPPLSFPSSSSLLFFLHSNLFQAAAVASSPRRTPN